MIEPITTLRRRVTTACIIGGRAAAGFCCRCCRSGCGTISGVGRPSRRSARWPITPSTGGIVHFDLANNYGSEYGTAEENFGRLMETSFRPYRDELFISTKAGYDMWPGPYGNWGSRKYLMASLDQSLRRMKLDYVDLFYSHRFDPATPLEETLQALVDIVRSGKALYVGLSRYPLEAARFAFDYLKRRDVPCLLFQDRYNLLDRMPAESGVLDLTVAEGSGFIVFSPLAQGLLTKPLSERHTGRFAHGREPGRSIARCSTRRCCGVCGGSMPWRANADSRWPRCRWRGCFATSASPR